MPKLKYKRILLKLSGEVLLGKTNYGIDNDTLNSIARYRTYTSNDTIDENVGFVISRGFLQTRSTTSLISTTNDLFAAIPICSDIDGTPDVVTLAARNISTGTSTLYGTISWVELE